MLAGVTDRSVDGRILVRVPTPLAVVVAGLSLLLGVWAAVRAVLDRPVVLRQLFAAGAVLALQLVQVVVAVVLTARGDAAGVDGVTFWGYLVTSLVLLPVAGAWAFAERTRWSSVVLLVAAATVAFLQLRLVQIWAGA